MLNRRSLRIKAMQRLFAFHQSRHSELETAIAVVNAQQPIEAGEGVELDTQAFEQEQAQAVKLLKNCALRQRFSPDPQIGKEVNQKAQEVWDNYRKRVVLDCAEQKRRMLVQVEEVPEHFRWILQLLVVLYQYATKRKNKKVPDGEILGRPLLNQLQKHPDIQEQDSWDPYIDQIRQWYRELKNDPGFHENEVLTFEQDQQALRSLTKALFKSESFNKFFEQKDLFWQEDKDVIKSLLNKTLKSADSVSLNLALLSYNWAEDKLFFQDIFDATLDCEEETETLIAEKAKNWEMDRIALLDRILLKMALAEMINFPSIPIKVTINEYIELSKIYSTPKSKKFINGLLDVLATDLQAQGKIKKSGRGLIDNS